MKRVKRAEAEFAHSVLQVADGEDDFYKWQKSATKKDSSANRSDVELAEAEFSSSVLQVAAGEDALLLVQQAIADKAASTNSHAFRLAEGEFARSVLLVAEREAAFLIAQQAIAKKVTYSKSSAIRIAEAEFARSVLQVAAGEDALLLAQQAIAEKGASTNSHAIRLAEGEFASSVLLVAEGEDALLIAQQNIAKKAASAKRSAIGLVELAQFVLLVAAGEEAVLEGESGKAATETVTRKEDEQHEDMVSELETKQCLEQGSQKLSAVSMILKVFVYQIQMAHEIKVCTLKAEIERLEELLSVKEQNAIAATPVAKFEEMIGDSGISLIAETSVADVLQKEGSSDASCLRVEIEEVTIAVGVPETAQLTADSEVEPLDTSIPEQDRTGRETKALIKKGRNAGPNPKTRLERLGRNEESVEFYEGTRVGRSLVKGEPKRRNKARRRKSSEIRHRVGDKESVV
jgi:hypothetical protein